MSYYKELVEIIKKEKPSKEKLSKIKIKLCKKHSLKKIPTDIEVMLSIPKKEIPLVKKYLLSKPIRNVSGVSVVAIMSKPHDCPHGRCSYCPGGLNSAFGDVPQSYTGKEPATRRAIRNNYDPYLQVMNRIEQYLVQGWVPEKIELIVMGGTLPSLPIKYQEEFIKYSFKAMNDFSKLFFRGGKFNLNKFKEVFELPADLTDKKRENRVKKKLLKFKGKCSLEVEQKKNENAQIRCIGMTLETRPSHARLFHSNEMLRLGCTRVELGIQSIYEDVLKNVNRGHTVKQSRESTKILKDLGFKINHHLMPGLPGVTRKMDLHSLKSIFSDSDFRPDMIKIYPCMVMKGTPLYNDWKKGKFKAITTKEAADLICKFKKTVPEYVRIMRILRDIPTYMTEAGVGNTNLRQMVQDEMKKKGVKCRCIRCREISRSLEDIKGYEIKVMEYDASNGKEFFISAEKNDKIIGFCRLRFPSQSLRKEITMKSALIRELHVYGESVQIGKQGRIQHVGVGKKLLKKAEMIAKQKRKKKIVIISGIGVRQYYRKFSYRLDGPYMSKNI